MCLCRLTIKLSLTTKTNKRNKLDTVCQATKGIPYQRGNGLGSFFGRLFWAILPVAKRVGKSALKNVGREALHMGSNVFGDLSKGRNIMQSQKQHGIKAGQNLIKGAASTMNNQSGGRIGKRTAAVTGKAVKKTTSATEKEVSEEETKWYIQ